MKDRRIHINGVARLDAQRVVTYLAQVGVLDKQKTLDTGVTVQDVSRRNQNFRVQYGDQTGLLVKQGGAPSNPLVFDSLEVESEVLKELNTLEFYEPLRPFIPKLAHRDASAGILATELISPGTSLTKFHLNGGQIQFPPEVAESIGGVLAIFHRCSAEALRQGHRAGRIRVPIGLGSLASTDKAWAGPGMRTLFESACEGMNTLAKARELVKRWPSGAEISHGDIRLDNFLLTSGESQLGPLNLRLIDWEIAAPGDGMWDLACLLTDYIRFWMLCGQAKQAKTLEEYIEKAPFQLSAIRPFAQALIAMYFRHRSYASEAEMAARARLQDFVSMALLAQGLEYMSNSAKAGVVKEIPSHVQAILALVREYEANPAAKFATWFGSPGEVDS